MDKGQIQEIFGQLGMTESLNELLQDKSYQVLF
jgi:hypothetical protein